MSFPLTTYLIDNNLLQWYIPNCSNQSKINNVSLIRKIFIEEYESLNRICKGGDRAHIELNATYIINAIKNDHKLLHDCCTYLEPSIDSSKLYALFQTLRRHRHKYAHETHQDISTFVRRNNKKINGT